MAITPRQNSILGLHVGGFHNINYYDWGDEENPNVVICVHGLTRHSRDFDPLAQELAKDFRVICPDIVGRGESDWLDDSKQYNFVQYSADMNALIARLGKTQVHWIGSSMGGFIGMTLASCSGSPLASLIINDAGPKVLHSELSRIGNYIGQKVEFSSFEEASGYFEKVYGEFGPLSTKQWKSLKLNSLRETEHGTFRLHYDPAIGDAFRCSFSFMHFNLWKYWDPIVCPTMVVRGETSKFLTRATAEEMTKRGPKAELIEIAGAGHTPMLSSKPEISAIRSFLKRHER